MQDINKYVHLFHWSCLCNIDWRNYSHEFYNDTIHDFQDCVYFSNRLNCLLHGNVLTNTPWALPELDTWKTYQRAFSHRNNYDIVGDAVYHSNPRQISGFSGDHLKKCKKSKKSVKMSKK